MKTNNTKIYCANIAKKDVLRKMLHVYTNLQVSVKKERANINRMIKIKKYVLS